MSMIKHLMEMNAEWEDKVEDLVDEAKEHEDFEVAMTGINMSKNARPMKWLLQSLSDDEKLVTAALAWFQNKGRESELGEAAGEQLYGVFPTGGSIGSRNDKPWKTGPKEEMKEYAKRMRSQLSPGERKYYKMGYSVRPIKGELTEAYISEQSNDEWKKQRKHYDSMIMKIAKDQLGEYVKKQIDSGQQSTRGADYTTFRVDPSLKRKGKEFRSFTSKLKNQLGKKFDRVGYLNGNDSVTVIYRPGKM